MVLLIKKNKYWKEALIAVLYWLSIVLLLYNLNHNEYLNPIINLYGYSIWVRFLLFVVFPFLLIKQSINTEFDYGIALPKLKSSFNFAIQCWAFVGPIGALAFGIVLFLLKWDYYSWGGTIIITTFYIIALILMVPVIGNYKSSISKPNTYEKFSNLLFSIGFLGIISIYIESFFPVLSSILVLIFIVGFGEEILFRGYLQSSFNLAFGKPFKIKGIEYGYGLIITAILFGLIHALIQNPFEWQRSLFTTVAGLFLGLIREKEDSIMTCGMLHALMDLPKLLTPNL